MLAQKRDEDKALTLVHRVVMRATRHQRAADEEADLRMDLAAIAGDAEELERLLGGMFEGGFPGYAYGERVMLTRAMTGKPLEPPHEVEIVGVRTLEPGVRDYTIKSRGGVIREVPEDFLRPIVVDQGREASAAGAVAAAGIRRFEAATNLPAVEIPGRTIVSLPADALHGALVEDPTTEIGMGWGGPGLIDVMPEVLEAQERADAAEEERTRIEVLAGVAELASLVYRNRKPFVFNASVYLTGKAVMERLGEELEVYEDLLKRCADRRRDEEEGRTA